MNALINSSEMPENFQKLLESVLSEKPDGIFNVELINSEYCAESLGIKPTRIHVRKQDELFQLQCLSSLSYVYQQGTPVLKESERLSVIADDSFVSGTVKYHIDADPMASRIIKNKLAVIAGFFSEGLYDSYNVSEQDMLAVEVA
ncbi:hypothetical protein [Vibrio sp. 10N.239.312.D08]|uniref:hypothetical protein n=1 Tax=Vibrio sp. 10N.239.312.D08 TaxID=3229978 RepID=UPI00354B1F17